MSRRRYFAQKRILDIVLSLAGLVVCGPAMLLTALAVRLTSEGPVLYRAKRVGQFRGEFEMLKFRTMVVNADQIGPAVTAGDDPRITKIGKILRRTKLDELPQFINVLMGEMSFVGPRPNAPSIIDTYSEEDREVLQVPQGITDYASLWFRMQEGLLEGTDDVMADYEAKVAPVKIRLGRYYARKATLRDDLRLIWATFTAVFLKRDPLWAFPSEAKAQALMLVERQEPAEIAEAA